MYQLLSLYVNLNVTVTVARWVGRSTRPIGEMWTRFVCVGSDARMGVTAPVAERQTVYLADSTADRLRVCFVDCPVTESVYECPYREHFKIAAEGTWWARSPSESPLPHPFIARAFACGEYDAAGARQPSAREALVALMLMPRDKCSNGEWARAVADELGMDWPALEKERQRQHVARYMTPGARK